MKKKIITIISAIICCSILCSCGSKDIENSSSEAVLTTTDGTTSGETETTLDPESLKPDINTINLLTGIDNLDSAASGKRPVAVMVNNNTQSLPQYGIEAADVMFEVPVEGGITRLMALYSDYNKVPNVCSIRSCRYYFPLISNGLDAIYIHWGSDQTIALETLKRLSISNLDGGEVGGPLFGRDAQRKKTYALEHTGYLNGSVLASTLESRGTRTDLKEGYNKSIFTFNDQNSPQSPQGQACTNLNIQFSNAYFSTFTYDEATKTYKKQHNGKSHKDSATGNQLAFTNVIILKTNVSIRDTRNGLLNIELTSGTGQYVSNGACEDILWSKSDDNSNFVITKADGSPLSINAGKSYVAIMDKTRPVSIQ